MDTVTSFCTCFARKFNWLIIKQNHKNLLINKNTRIHSTQTCKVTNIGLGLSGLRRRFKHWLPKGFVFSLETVRDRPPLDQIRLNPYTSILSLITKKNKPDNNDAMPYHWDNLQ